MSNNDATLLITAIDKNSLNRNREVRLLVEVNDRVQYKQSSANRELLV